MKGVERWKGHDGTGWTIAPRRDWVNDGGSTPGPGSYGDVDAHRKIGGTRKGFGNHKDRGLPLTSTAPGPGSYDHQSTKGRAFSFTPRRTPRPYGTGEPGPGTYGRHVDMACEGPKFSFPPRREELWKDGKIPGPGTYEPPQGLKIPSKTKTNGMFGFADRGSLAPHNSAWTPGPGTYGKEITKAHQAVPLQMKTTATPRKQIKLTSVSKEAPVPQNEGAKKAQQDPPAQPEKEPVPSPTAEAKKSPSLSPKAHERLYFAPKAASSKKAPVPSPKVDDKKVSVPSPNADGKKQPLASPKAEEKKAPVPPPKANEKTQPPVSPKADYKKGQEKTVDNVVQNTLDNVVQNNVAPAENASVTSSPPQSKTEVAVVGTKEVSAEMAGTKVSPPPLSSDTCTPDVSKQLESVDDDADMEIEEDFDDDFEKESDDGGE